MYPLMYVHHSQLHVERSLCVKELILDVNYTSTTQYGCTPLVTAAVNGKCDVVIELLDNGADVNAQNDVSPINTVYTTLIPHLNNKSIVLECILLGQA